jgi:MinD-like ATPase involved in chromosome partitioning or flagellar assembly
MREEKQRKIVVIDKDERFGKVLHLASQQISYHPLTVRYFKELIIDECKDAYCVLIDARLIKDIKNMVEIFHALMVHKIVIVTDSINHPYTNDSIMMGTIVFYRHAPITTLFPKIIDGFYPKKMNHPIPGIPKEQNIDFTKSLPPKASNLSKFITFFSLKGGVGKTSILLNCAISYAQKKQKVLVLDFSSCGSIRSKLKINSSNLFLSNLILKGRKENIDMESAIKKSIYHHSFPEGSFDVLTPDTPIHLSNMQIESTEYLYNILQNQGYDLILTDTGSNISSLNISLLQLSDSILLVSTGDISSTWAMIQNSEVIQNLNLNDLCKLVINMENNSYPALREELSNHLPYPIIGSIPTNYMIPSMENKGDFIALNPHDPFHIHYKIIAHDILPVFSSEDMTFNKKNPLLEFIKNLTEKK